MTAKAHIYLLSVFTVTNRASKLPRPFVSFASHSCSTACHCNSLSQFVSVKINYIYTTLYLLYKTTKPSIFVIATNCTLFAKDKYTFDSEIAPAPISRSSRRVALPSRSHSFVLPTILPHTRCTQFPKSYSSFTVSRQHLLFLKSVNPSIKRKSQQTNKQI